MSEKWTNKYDALIAENNQHRERDNKGSLIPSIDKSLDLKTLGQGVYFEYLSLKDVENLSEQDNVAYKKYFEKKKQQNHVRANEFVELRKLQEENKDFSEGLDSLPSRESSSSGKSLDPSEIIKIIDEMEAEMSGEWFGVDSKENYEEPFAVSYRDFVGMPLDLTLHDFSYYKDRLAEILNLKTERNEDVSKGTILMQRLEDALMAKAEASISAAEMAPNYSGTEEVQLEEETIIPANSNSVEVELPVLPNSFELTHNSSIDSTQHPEIDISVMRHYNEAMTRAEESSKLVEAPFLIKIQARFPTGESLEGLESDLANLLAVEIALKLTEGNIKKLNRVAPNSKMKVLIEEDIFRLKERQRILNESLLVKREEGKYITDAAVLELEMHILEMLKSEFSNEQMHAVAGLFKQKERELSEMTASADAGIENRTIQPRTIKSDIIKTAKRELPNGAFSPTAWGVRHREE